MQCVAESLKCAIWLVAEVLTRKRELRPYGLRQAVTYTFAQIDQEALSRLSSWPVFKVYQRAVEPPRDVRVCLQLVEQARLANPTNPDDHWRPVLLYAEHGFDD